MQACNERKFALAGYHPRMTAKPGLRERKRERARRALADAAITLFSTRGYEETTIADLAAAADISPRTFFSHFASKEDVLFADPPLRLTTLASILAAPRPDETPAGLLVRAIRAAIQETDLTGEPQRARAALIISTPALHVGALRKVIEGQRGMTQALLDVFPGRLDRVSASSLVGAVLGALVGAITMLYADPVRSVELGEDPQRMREELDRVLCMVCTDLAAVDVHAPSDTGAVHGVG